LNQDSLNTGGNREGFNGFLTDLKGIFKKVIFMGFGVWGLGFGVWGLGFGVWGLGVGVWEIGRA
jgi:hypothetical protein